MSRRPPGVEAVQQCPADVEKLVALLGAEYVEQVLAHAPDVARAGGAQQALALLPEDGEPAAPVVLATASWVGGAAATATAFLALIRRKTE